MLFFMINVLCNKLIRTSVYLFATVCMCMCPCLLPFYRLFDIRSLDPCAFVCVYIQFDIWFLVLLGWFLFFSFLFHISKVEVYKLTKKSINQQKFLDFFQLTNWLGTDKHLASVTTAHPFRIYLIIAFYLYTHRISFMRSNSGVEWKVMEKKRYSVATHKHIWSICLHSEIASHLLLWCNFWTQIGFITPWFDFFFRFSVPLSF